MPSTTLKKNSAANADKLKYFFDSKYWNQMHTASTFSRPTTSTYSPLLSWEGMSQKSTPFSRLENNFTINAPTKQFGIAGKQVFEMETPSAGGVFYQAVNKDSTAAIPPTLEQIESGTILANSQEQPQEDNNNSNQSLLIPVADKEIFALHKVTRAGGNVHYQEKPAVMDEALSKNEEMLLNPYQRRKILETERDANRAKKIIKKAKADKIRLEFLMKNRYPSGAVGVDSTANTESPFYAEECIKQLGKKDKKEMYMRHRSEFLKERWNASERLGFEPLHHAIIPNTEYTGHEIKDAEGKGSLKKLMQTKGRGGAAPKMDTYDRLFGQDPLKINEARRQHLHDQDLGGKTFDLTGTHKRQYYQPCVYIPKVREDKVLIHPSQVSLNQTRNLQGTVKVSDRFIDPCLDPAF